MSSQQKRTRAHLPKPKPGAWFVALRGSYIPVAWQGWLTYIPYVGYLVVSFYLIFENVQNTIQPAFIYAANVIGVLVVMHWIAWLKS